MSHPASGRLIVLFLCAAALLSAAAPVYRAGAARREITPSFTLRESGYYDLNKATQAGDSPLYVRALAIEDDKGERIVIVTADLIGAGRALTDAVSAACGKRYGLDRRQILFNFSHTHDGPAVGDHLRIAYNLNAEQLAAARQYQQFVAAEMEAVVGEALRNSKPARLAFNEGTVGFAANRQSKAIPGGPVDHSVPVLKVTAEDGALLAVLFGYACHNVVLNGESRSWSSDYSGAAQSELESRHAGAVAVFLMLCGGDQNPAPMGKAEFIQQHGHALAAEVERLLAQPDKPLKGRLLSRYTTEELPLRPHTRDQFEQALTDTNPLRVRHARAMLTAYDERRVPRQVPYPMQMIRWGKDLTLIALGGEPVVDYALRIKREHPKEAMIVAGYSNDVVSYIPSRSVLLEGGYESGYSMLNYGLPAPYTEEIEDRIFAALQRLMK